MTMPKEFPAAIRVGDEVYLGGRPTANRFTSIESQTEQAFQTLVSNLEAAGLSMADLVNLRTYYVYSGQGGRDVTDYWERMTAVRLRFIADPGPAATAVRVLGAPLSPNLICVDGIATAARARQRIMPEHAWDWSIPVPLSQGWRAGDKIYVGGQISADRAGKAIDVEDLRAQTRNVLEYIHHVLLDGGQNWRNLIELRVCFQHGGDEAAAHELLSTIGEVLRSVIPEPRPPLTAFGVDLLYEGLLLEIDAVSISGPSKDLVRYSGRSTAVEGFPLAAAAGNELHIGGLSCADDAGLEEQVRGTFSLLAMVLAKNAFEANDVVKLSLFFTSDGKQESGRGAHDLIEAAAAEFFEGQRPVLTILTVRGLPLQGQLFQLDAVAIRNRPKKIID